MGAARLFISYSRQDEAIITRLHSDLRQAGAVIWIDHEQLPPGTPNWQLAIRDGIEAAQVVVYVASPEAARSAYVIDEVSLARVKGRQVVPFWVRGEQWHDCAPLGFGMTQFADGRGDRYDQGLHELLAALGLPTELSQAIEAVASPADATPAATQRPTWLPESLAALGFEARTMHGVDVILPPLCDVPGGEFLMGSDPKRDGLAKIDEQPQHRVPLPSFQIGRYPVTVAEYACAMRAKAVAEPQKGGLGIGVTWERQLRQLDHPVVCIRWSNAVDYAHWLALVTGQPWHVPTEAEWEKAARGTDGRTYPWGDAFDKDRCNAGHSRSWTTTPVGRYPYGASPYGAQDLAGNVLEWTSSHYKQYPYRASDGREHADMASNRPLRGGSWRSGSLHTRAAYREHSNYGYEEVGFRLAVSNSAGLGT